MTAKTKFALLRRAFISSLPVLMGYSTMGFAAGVLLSAHGKLDFPAAWGALFSAVCVSGALQFMTVDWIASTTALRDVAVLTLCLNLRYAMYGLSLLEKFKGIGFLKKCYLIWTMTDETYALEVESKLPKGGDHVFYCLMLSALDHFYWIFGVTAGALAGKALPFSNKGIDFAMTALFLVILIDQLREPKNRIPALVGGGAALFACILFGAGKMLIPAIILMIVIFLVFRKHLEGRCEA